ncbi:kinase non-catalytic C-lobe domain-containing protein 1 [Ambystoma mexicanum]|uniref:kinase non-catalytic C-lobe domain-containing protein 1 n=1 Tax=Ambystoma mexicanum TaxID=8296 RepID=UPI0037E8F48B
MDSVQATVSEHGEDEQEGEQPDFFDFAPMPALLEDEENVSLADILSLRDTYLTEQDVWAICLECCCSIKSIVHLELFQTLCITPDTLAFNTNGNVCFMEPLSDDLEGDFVPPEFDVTGNTFEAHVYSLGATLQAAIEYVVEPELEPEFSEDLVSLLEHMLDEIPLNRPDIETIIQLCEERLNYCSSLNICRSLSAAGRRVLSLESVAAFQDVSENLWKGKKCKAGKGMTLLPNDNVQACVSSASNDLASNSCQKKCNDCVVRQNEKYHCSLKRTNHLHDANRLKKCEEMPETGNNFDSMKGSCNIDKDQLYVSKSCPPKEQQRFSQCEGGVLDRRSTCSHNYHLKNVSRENMLPQTDLLNSNGCQDVTDNSSLCESRTHQPQTQNSPISLQRIHEHSSTGAQQSSTGSENNLICYHEKIDSLPCVSTTSPQSPGAPEPLSPKKQMTTNFAAQEVLVKSCIVSEENASLEMTEGTMPLNVTPQKVQCGATHANAPDAVRCPSGNIEEIISDHEQWTALKDLLSWHGKPLKEYEVWALCQECLFTLQTYIEFPAYLCLDSVIMDSHGEILFVAPKDDRSNDTFCVPPEFEDQECITEKACVYAVAAILWTAAKCNVPINEKLILPKKLKRLLLNMAKRNYEDRPPLDEVIKMCSDYLQLHNLSSRHVLAQLSKQAYQAYRYKAEATGDTDEPEAKYIDKQSLTYNLGFVPISSERKLTAVKGPVPCQPSTHKETFNLPVAFTSSATYFKPIILKQNTDNSRNKNICGAPSSAQPSCNGNGERIVANRESITLDDIEMHAANEHISSRCPLTPEGVKSSKCLPSNAFTTSPERLHLNNSVSSTTQSIATSYYASDLKETVSSTASSSSSACSLLPSSPLGNNFFIKQDTKAGVFKHAPMQLEIPDQIPSLHLPAEEACDCLHKPHGHVPGTLVEDLFDVTTHNSTCKLNNCDQNQHKDINSLNVIDSNEFPNVPLAAPSQHRIGNCQETKDFEKESYSASFLTCSPGASVDATSTCFIALDSSSTQQKRTLCPSLERVVHCIQDEFAFDGYLENGVEDLAMGEYIVSLKGLQFGTFCDAVSEKFCDLYWDEKLLQALYKEVNGQTPTLGSTEKNASTSSTATRSFTRKPAGEKKKRQHLSNNPRVKSIVLGEQSNILSEQPNLSPLHNMSDEENIVAINIQSGKEKQVIDEIQTEPTTDESTDDTDFSDLLSSVSFEKDDIKESLEPTNRKEDDLVDSPGLQTKHYCLGSGLTELDDNRGLVKEPVGSRSVTSPVPSDLSRLCPGWSSAFYGARTFNPAVQRYMKNLGRQTQNDPQDFEPKRLELEQQLMFESKNYKRTVMFYQKLLQKYNTNRGSEAKTMLSKLKDQLEEMKSKLQFLELVKKCLQVTCAEQWGLEISALPTVANITTQSDIFGLSRSDESSLLVFYNFKEWQSDNHKVSRLLQAGTPLGLMAYLYSSNAVQEGYVQQFLYTFRYFCTQEEFLQFLIDRVDCSISSECMDPSAMLTKIYHRSIYLIQTWIENCCNIDFTPNTNLLDRLEEYISFKITPRDVHGEHLLSLLQELSSQKHSSVSPGSSLGEKRDDEETKSLSSFCFKLSEDNLSRKSFSWKISKGNEPFALHQKDKVYALATGLPRTCYASYIEDYSGSYVKADERGPYLFSDYSVQQFAQQLTLLQERIFQNCHPVHFLNSRALGVGDKPSILLKSFRCDSPLRDGCSPVMPNSMQNKYLLHLLRFAENVSTWVAAEIVTSPTPKLQVNLLSTFLLIAKSCYEHRDFATSMQILAGLENLIVRPLPAWKNLPSKVSEILDHLKAVEVFLKSDSLCLMEGDRFKILPTIPSAHILAMHVQQLETGGFTMTNGAYKWSKLRNIAKVVSQVHAFQEIPYVFTPDPELQFYLNQRINLFSEADISVLAASNNVNFHHQPADRNSRKINDTFRKMKATFQ